jgi:hypothetical protein
MKKLFIVMMLASALGLANCNKEEKAAPATPAAEAPSAKRITPAPAPAIARTAAPAPGEAQGVNATDPAQVAEYNEIINSVALDNTLITRFIATLPDFARKAKEIGISNEANPESYFARSEIVTLLGEKGWTEPKQFLAVNGRIAKAIPWLAMQMADANAIPAELRAQMEARFAGMLEGLSEAELAALRDNAEALKGAFEAAAAVSAPPQP